MVNGGAAAAARRARAKDKGGSGGGGAAAPSGPDTTLSQRGSAERANAATAFRMARGVKDSETRGELLRGLKDARAGQRSAATAAARADPKVVAQLDRAFNAANRSGDNFVKLRDLRNRLPGVSRPQLDAAIRAGRLSGKYTLDSHEGLHGKLTRSERRAAIVERGGRLVYISRR